MTCACEAGTDATTHYCCMVDPAVAPLFYLFQNHPEVLDELETTCNRAMLDVPGVPPSAILSYPIFSKFTILSALRQVKDGYYAVPIRSDTAAAIRQYTAVLNSILNDFSPREGLIAALLLLFDSGTS